MESESSDCQADYIGPKGYYLCTEPDGHEGPHRACGFDDDYAYEEWAYGEGTNPQKDTE